MTGMLGRDDGARFDLVSLLTLLALAVLIAVARLHTFDEPLERDLCNYAVIGHEMAGGRQLYSDLWDNKPPGIYVTYALAESVAGYSMRAVYLLNLVAAFVTLAGVYATGTSLGLGRAAGLWAAVFWTVCSGDMMLEANQPNTEVFINGCLIWAFVLFVRWDANTQWLRRALAVGALFAVASLYKHVAVAPAALLAGVHIAFPPGGPSQRRRALAEVGVMAGVGCAAWAGVVGYFAATGHLRAFIDVNVTFASCFAKWQNLVRIFQPDQFLPSHVLFLIPLFVLSGLGVVLQCLASRSANPAPTEQRRAWWLWSAYAVAVPIAVAMPGYFSRHYYQYWLPVLAVGAAWTVAMLSQFRRWLPATAGAMALLLLLDHELPLYARPAEDWSREKYGTIFVASKDTAKKLDELLLLGETFYEWGAESGLYFYSDRRPPTGVLFNYVLSLCCDPAMSQALEDRMRRDLERERPELLIVPTSVAYYLRDHPLLMWLVAQYRLLPMGSPDRTFHLCALRGGKLEARCIADGFIPAIETPFPLRPAVPQP